MMSLSWSEKHEQVIKKCLESEDTFRTYLTSAKYPGNVRRAFLAFTGLVNLFSELINEREELEKKVKEHQETRMRMESALTYVEDQLATLRAAQTAPAPVALTPPIVPTPLIVYPTLPATAPASVAPVTSSDLDPTPPTSSITHETKNEPNGKPHRVIKILDPPIFHGKPGVDQLLYKDWLLKMKNKL